LQILITKAPCSLILWKKHNWAYNPIC